jgi:hypothetical protein
MPWILNVLMLANLEDRASIVMKRDRVSREEALRFLRKIDEQRRRWSRRLYGLDPWDPGLYDLVLRIDKIRIKDAVDIICRTVALKPFQTTPDSLRAMVDMALAAEVKSALVDLKPTIGVRAENGSVYVSVDPASFQNQVLIQKMEQTAESIPGVLRIHFAASEALDKTYRHPSEKTTESTSEKSSTYFSEL